MGSSLPLNTESENKQRKHRDAIRWFQASQSPQVVLFQQNRRRVVKVMRGERQSENEPADDEKELDSAESN